MKRTVGREGNGAGSKGSTGSAPLCRAWCSIFSVCVMTSSSHRGCPSRSNEYLIDSVEIHIQHFEAEPSPFKMLACRGYMLHIHHHEAAQGLIVAPFFSRQLLDAEDFFELVHWHHSIQ